MAVKDPRNKVPMKSKSPYEHMVDWSYSKPFAREAVEELYRMMNRPPSPTYSFVTSPHKAKISAAIQRACDALPVRLTMKVEAIRFGPDGATEPEFEVVYVGGKVITFDNVDTFPTDADIARIALECP